MIRIFVVLLFAAALFVLPTAAAVTEFDAKYSPEGVVAAGQELTVSEEVFVGERFSSFYTLKFDTDLSDPVWHIALIVENRTTQTWEFPYSHGTISGFTISTAERDTWLSTTLTGTPRMYDEGKEIMLWRMKVMTTDNYAKDTFVSKPVKVESPPVPTAGPLPSTAVTTAAATAPQTTPGVPTTTATIVPATEITSEVPSAPPATPQSFFCCEAGFIAVLSLLMFWRR